MRKDSESEEPQFSHQEFDVDVESTLMFAEHVELSPKALVQDAKIWCLFLVSIRAVPGLGSQSAASARQLI